MINKHNYIYLFIINLSFLFAQGMPELEDSQNVFDTSKLRNEISRKVRNQFSKIVSQAEIIDEGKYIDSSAHWKLTNDGTLTIFGKNYPFHHWQKNDQPWKKHRSKIKNVIVQEGIEELGDNAFSNLYRLEKVTFPNSLRSIRSIFDNTHYNFLKILHIPNNVQFINGSMSQFNIEIDGGLDSVIEGTCGKNAKFKFDKDTGTLKIYGSGEIEIYNYKWHLYKEHIKKVSIEDKISNIPARAFIHCYNLESVAMTSNITSIQYRAFANCISLKEIFIPKTVISQGIEPTIFDGCTSNLVVQAPKHLQGRMKKILPKYITIQYY